MFNKSFGGNIYIFNFNQNVCNILLDKFQCLVLILVLLLQSSSNQCYLDIQKSHNLFRVNQKKLIKESLNFDFIFTLSKSFSKISWGMFYFKVEYKSKLDIFYICVHWFKSNTNLFSIDPMYSNYKKLFIFVM